MIPAYDDVLSELNFAQISKTDKRYADLVRAEYDYCKRTKSVYKIGCNKNHRLKYTCCDFPKLEREYINYKSNN